MNLLNDQQVILCDFMGAAGEANCAGEGNDEDEDYRAFRHHAPDRSGWDALRGFR